MYSPRAQTPSPYPSYGVPHDPVYRIMAGLKAPSRMPWALLALVVVGVGYVGQLAWKEQSRLVALVEKGEASERSRRELEVRYRTLEAERDGLAAARAALPTGAVEASSGGAGLAATVETLQDKLKEEISRGEITLSQGGGRLRVDLADRMLFQAGGARISKRGALVLGRVGAVLASIDDRQLQVSGHTDNKPPPRRLRRQFPTNWDLSIGHAMTVVRFLQNRAGVAPERLVASGHGEHHPIDSNRTIGGRARNRRIEILVTPAVDPQRLSAVKLKDAADPAKRD